MDSFQEESASGSLPTLSLDMGVIPSLVVVCWRCHDFNVRQQALNLLEAWPHREGPWDSRLLVLFVKQMFQVELEALASSSDSLTSTHVDVSTMKLPEDQTHYVFIYQTREPGQEAQEQRRIVSFDEDA